MSFRMAYKVPKYGLFYFESDKTISIVPTKNIKTVLSGDKVTPGSLMALNYAGVNLKAELISVNDDQTFLHQEEVKFVSNPANAHPFPKDDHEPQPTERETTKKRKQSQERPQKDKRPAKAQKKSKSVEKQRKQAIVIATYSPAGPSASSDAEPEPEPEPERPVPAPSTPATPQHQQPYRRLSFSPRYSAISPCSSLCSLIYQPSISTLDATYSHHSSPLLRGPESLRDILLRIEHTLDVLLQQPPPAPTAPYQTPTPVISTFANS
ncbi:hypothetical protein AC249_AIPGENE6037 [Exaiptasia diaphana]|nr:hypothetical protein AC249_AIPGENE6037 [Exaiptasia diaphana]